MQSLQGKLLIASAALMDPNFSRTVVLIVQHNEEGALGLILNRRLDVTVRSVCEQAIDKSCLIEGFLHQGGPCDGPLMVVHTRKTASDIEIIPGAHFATNREHIEWLVDHNGEQSIKFFIGYSGWSKGQLEAELEGGSWLTMDSDPQQIFEGIDDHWSQLMTRLTVGGNIDPRRIPPDPSLN